jgi:hypothetical protein
MYFEQTLENAGALTNTSIDMIAAFSLKNRQNIG